SSPRQVTYRDIALQCTQGNGSVYYCFDSVRDRVAAITNLSENTSFHSLKKDRTIKPWDQTPGHYAYIKYVEHQSQKKLTGAEQNLSIFPSDEKWLISDHMKFY
ncbi:MAG: hypothetical protein ABIR04_14445, partial [Cypionkella sp.]